MLSFNEIVNISWSSLDRVWCSHSLTRHSPTNKSSVSQSTCCSIQESRIQFLAMDHSLSTDYREWILCEDYKSNRASHQWYHCLAKEIHSVPLIAQIQLEGSYLTDYCHPGRGPSIWVDPRTGMGWSRQDCNLTCTPIESLEWKISISGLCPSGRWWRYRRNLNFYSFQIHLVPLHSTNSCLIGGWLWVVIRILKLK